MERFTIYAGPAHKYGLEHIWQPLNFGGPRTVEMDFGTIASAPSAGEIKVNYFDRRQGNSEKHVVVPGKIIIYTGDCLCSVRIRAKSYTTGQAYEVTVRNWPSRF